MLPKIKWVIRCNNCNYIWKTSEKIESTITCPLCGTKNKVNTFVNLMGEDFLYFMGKEERRHRNSIKYDVGIAAAAGFSLLFVAITMLTDPITKLLIILVFVALMLIPTIWGIIDYYQANRIRELISKHKKKF